MSVQSNTTHLPNVEPYNTFIINCTATVPESVISRKVFTWSVSDSNGIGYEPSRAVTLGNDHFQIVTNEVNHVSTSSMTVTETTAGNYSYHCQVELEGHNTITNETDVHPIIVTGKNNIIMKIFFFICTTGINIIITNHICAVNI